MGSAEHIGYSVIYGLIIGFIITYASSKFVALTYVVFFSIAYTMQYSNLAYFGYWMSPMDIWLLLEKSAEVLVDGVAMIGHLSVSIVLILLVCAAFTLCFKMRQQSKQKSRALSVFGLILLLFYPVKMMLDRDFDLGRLPKLQHTAVKTSLYTASRFFAHILPDEILGLSAVKPALHPAPASLNEGLSDNIIFVMGESLSSDYMGVFGYDQPTTPWLTEQKKEGLGLIKQGFSGGLFTDISVPYLFNMIEKPNARQQIERGTANLFRLAKLHGYQTHFLSAQMRSGLALTSKIGKQWVDDYADSSSITGDEYQPVDDSQLLDWLSKIDANKKNFIVLHQNGSHEPYAIRSPLSSKVFGTSNLLEEYLNSVHYTDSILKAINSRLETLPGKWTLLFTSDHGQHVSKTAGGKGNFKYSSNYDVPIFIKSNVPQVRDLAGARFDQCPKVFQVQLSAFVAEVLGYSNDFTSCQSGYISGKRLTGDSGYMKLTRLPDTDEYQSKILYR
ncbi:hypothetical protein A8L45_06325 [Veronia pacifica]|uniref:Sulfatase N-terminal domain-containing protein n=2 Tax=Veronia pacifica TaxID=1080227 RepID=A0A1C3EM57_9GAMM|nr:hypothetical protein A8L45_06325 [Veronia pacifica]